MRYLHEKLHAFREGIAGDNIKPAAWLKKELREIIPIAELDDPRILANLANIERMLEELHGLNMRLRIEIDQIVCKIINEQDQRLLQKGGWQT